MCIPLTQQKMESLEMEECIIQGLELGERERGMAERKGRGKKENPATH